MQNVRLQRTISSALWSAYADALGFPTELASLSTVERRIGTPRSNRTVPWKRMIGGRSGTTVKLPAGAYSDDTQLRLATCRAIRADGFFDVESFSKVELPTWLSYALGAGRGSKDAAGSLTNRNVAWFSNFFPNYVNGGGNGAAMRIQPHVWAARDTRKSECFLPDVLRNAVCTHGHLRGIVGAVIHAISLAHIYSTEEASGPLHWRKFCDDIARLPKMINDDYELRTFWLPTWESTSKNSLENAIDEIINEWRANVELASRILSESTSDLAATYYRIVESCGGLNESERGSGLKCALFANVATFIYGHVGVRESIETVVNFLGSDTDTIGTMAGALLGAWRYEKLPCDILQDELYITSEAKRLFDISRGMKVDTHHYPDLLFWQPVKIIADIVSSDAGALSLEGISYVRKVKEIFPAKQKDISWIWAELEIGQSVLCKVRDRNLSGIQYERNESRKSDQNFSSIAHGESLSLSLDLDDDKITSNNTPGKVKNADDIIIEEDDNNPLDYLDKITDEVIKSGFNKELLGEKILAFAEVDNGIELAIAFSAIIIKAKRARLKKNINS